MKLFTQNLKSFLHAHVVTNVFDILSSMKQKQINCEECISHYFHDVALCEENVKKIEHFFNNCSTPCHIY